MATLRTIGRVSLCTLSALAVSCDAAISTGPDNSVAGRVIAITDLAVTADAGWNVPISPAVRVLDASGTVPVPGVIVRFAVTAGGGAIQSAGVRTDANGVATPGWWQLGDTATTNTLVASVEGLSTPETFTATAKSRRAIAQFDLVTIGNDSVPDISNGAALVGGRYVLFDDGSAVYGYDTGSGFQANPLAYQLTGQLDGIATVTFSYAGGPLLQFYEQQGGAFARGQLANGIMTVTYTSVDFDTEVYRLAK